MARRPDALAKRPLIAPAGSTRTTVAPRRRCLKRTMREKVYPFYRSIPLQRFRFQTLDGEAATTLYAASGRLIPFNSNSPTGSTSAAFSTFVSTRGLMRIDPALPHRTAERRR